MYDPNAYDVEPRRKFQATQTAQFIITLILLITSAKLIYDGPDCGNYSLWNTVLFYGSLIWMVYLVITLVVQFRNEGMRLFLGYLDYIWLLWVAFMWVWLYIIIGKYTNGSCAQRWELHTNVYWVMGWVLIACIACVIIMGVLRLVNHKTQPTQLDASVHNAHRHGDYEILDQSAI